MRQEGVRGFRDPRFTYEVVEVRRERCQQNKRHRHHENNAPKIAADQMFLARDTILASRTRADEVRATEKYRDKEEDNDRATCSNGGAHIRVSLLVFCQVNNQTILGHIICGRRLRSNALCLQRRSRKCDTMAGTHNGRSTRTKNSLFSASFCRLFFCPLLPARIQLAER